MPFPPRGMEVHTGEIPPRGNPTGSGRNSTGAPEIQSRLSRGQFPAAQGCAADPQTSAAARGNEHRESVKNFKRSGNSYRNGEDERNKASKSGQIDRWLLWSKKCNKRKKKKKSSSGSRALFEGVKHQ